MTERLLLDVKEEVGKEDDDNTKVKRGSFIRSHRSFWEPLQTGVKKYTFAKYLSKSSTCFAISVVTLHVSLGVLFFCLYPGERWQFLDALYFTVVTLTTVGYGDDDPNTTGGKLFVAVYVIVGLVVVFNFLNSIMQGLWDSHEQFVVGLLEGSEEDEEDEEDEEGAKKGPKEIEPPTMSVFIVACTLFLFLFVLGIVVGMAIEGWGFLDAFYFVCISATTVGFGDLHPTKDEMKIFCVFWLLFLTLGLGNVISEYQTYEMAKRNYATRKNILNKRWTRRDFKSFDRDRDGAVGELEFIIETLLQMELVKQNEIEAISNQFRRRDVDGSGTITIDDILKSRAGPQN
eukprot:g818.t1